MYNVSIQLFKILLALITIVSFYILLYKLCNKKFNLIHSWHFPMLSAMCLETFIAL